MKTLLLILCLALVMPAAPPAFVVNNGSALLTVVDLGTRQVLGQVNVGSDPRELLILPDNRTGLLTEAGGLLRRLDLKQRVSVTTIPVVGGPGSLVATPDMRFVYVANDASNDVSVVDLSTNAEIKRIPVGTTPVQVNMRPDGRFVYAVNQDSNSISVIDTSTNTVVNTLAVGSRPNQFAIDPPQRRAYIPNRGSSSLTIFDLATNAIVGSALPLPGSGPAVVNFSANGQTVFVVMNASSAINVVDVRGVQPRVTRTIPVGAQPTDLAVTFDGLFGYAAASGASQVWVIDFTRGEADPISVGAQPFSVSFDPDENFVFVTELGAGRVSVIDTNTDRVVGSMTVGTSPTQLAQLNPPTVPPGSVVNGASFTPSAPVAPGSIASVFGLGLAVVDQDGLLVRTFGGTQVRFAGVAAPLYAVHDNQINVQVPTALTGTSSATLEVFSPNGSETTTVSVAAVAPGIFSFSSDGKGPGAILHPDFSPVTAANPAVAGEVVLIYLTGLGPTNPPVSEGQLAPVATATTPVSVTIGGKQTGADYAGTAPGFAGLYQINAAVPSGLASGAQPVIVSAGGMTSNTVTIAVR